jgi:hypothetical protein
MSKPSEHKTVQARILAYAQEIGWTLVLRAEAERRRGFDADAATAEERARRASLYFGDLLYGQLRAFNPLYHEAEGAGIGQWEAAAFHLIHPSRFCPDCATNPQEMAQRVPCATKRGFCGAKTDFAPS